MWLELHDALLDHVKVKRMSRAVTRPSVTVRGHLVTLWLNILRHAPDGNLVDWTNADIADYAEWDGDPDAFVKALIACRLLDETSDGHIEAHDWREYAGQLKVAERKRNERARKKSVTAESRDVTRQSRDSAGHVRDATANVALTGPDQTRPDRISLKHSEPEAKQTPAPSADTGLGGERDRARQAELQRLEAKCYERFGGLYGEPGRLIEALLPITDAELTDALRSPAKSWKYLAKVIRSAREAPGATPPPQAPAPANNETFERRKLWLTIAKRHGIYGHPPPAAERELLEMAITPEKLEACCIAADAASVTRGATWDDVATVARGELAIAVSGSAA